MVFELNQKIEKLVINITNLQTLKKNFIYFLNFELIKIISLPILQIDKLEKIWRI